MRQAHALHEQITVVIDSREQAPYRFRRMALADLVSLGGFRRFLTDILWRTTGPGNEGLMSFLDRLWDHVCPESWPDILVEEPGGGILR